MCGIKGQWRPSAWATRWSYSRAVRLAPSPRAAATNAGSRHLKGFAYPSAARCRVAGPFWSPGAAGLVLQVWEGVCKVQLENGEHTLSIRPGDLRRKAGTMHGNGEGACESRRRLELAAAQGDAEAQHVLGAMHYNGEGGSKDLAEATWLYGLAAAQGNAEAQRSLGAMHYLGNGGPVDFAEARRLYGLAAAQGGAEVQRLCPAICTAKAKVGR